MNESEAVPGNRQVYLRQRDLNLVLRLEQKYPGPWGELYRHYLFMLLQNIKGLGKNDWRLLSKPV